MSRSTLTPDDRHNLVGIVASLAAAISLLERSPKTAAPSNTMFDIMLNDYREALAKGRQTLLELHPGVPEPKPKKPLAEEIYDGELAQSLLTEQLDNLGIDTENIGWDYYDNSLEIHKVTPEYRLDEKTQEVIRGMGFTKIYVNHTDKWETHYSYAHDKPFAPTEGWRVSYPHKRNDGTTPIYVEKPVPSWPKEWFETGKVVIVEKT
jgi:hypothetical protein